MEHHFHEDQVLIHLYLSHIFLPTVDTLQIFIEWVKKLNISLLAK